MALHLSELLAPFFPRGTPNTLSDGFPTWGQNEEEAKASQSLCQHFFERALRLKVNILLTGKRYEMRTFAAGTKFNSAEMRAETRKGGPISISNRKNAGPVKLCLFPALYSYPVHYLPSGDQVGAETSEASSVVMQTCNFFRTGDKPILEKAAFHGTATVVVDD
jgi:hypothetical protein